VAETVNLVKLCVGIDSVQQLESYRAQRRREGLERPDRHITRMWPRRQHDLLNGGSLYWVIKGVIQARQRVVRLEEVIGDDGIRRCGIVMDPAIIRTQAARRRAFQGWRYLAPADSPPDLDVARTADSDLPMEMQLALAEIGLR